MAVQARELAFAEAIRHELEIAFKAGWDARASYAIWEEERSARDEAYREWLERYAAERTGKR